MKFPETTGMSRSSAALACALQLFAASLLAQAPTLDPLLAPHAERYGAAVDELRKARKAEAARYETEYAQKLDASIAAVKDEATIAKLRKEREGVVKGLL